MNPLVSNQSLFQNLVIRFLVSSLYSSYCYGHFEQSYQLHFYSKLFHYFHQIGPMYGVVCMFIINIELIYIYLIFT